MPGDPFDTDFADSDLEGTDITQAAATGQATTPNPGGGKRMRVTRDMVSLRYRLKEFWKAAGLELLLILIIFLSLRAVLGTGTDSRESRLLLSNGVLLSQGRLSMAGLDKQYKTLTDHEELRTRFAYSITFPLALINLAGIGGHLAATILTLLMAGGSLILIYVLGKGLYNVEAGILSALILVLFPGYVAHAAGFTGLSFGMFYLLVSLFLFLKANRSNSLLQFLLAGVFFAAACYASSWLAVFLLFLPLYYFHFKTFKPVSFFFLAGAVAFMLLCNLVCIIFLKGVPLLDLRVLWRVQEIMAGASSMPDPYLALGDLLNTLFSSPLLLPFSLLSLLALGYALRAGSTSHSFLPLLLLLAAYLMLEFFPLRLDPYTTLAKHRLALSAFALPLSLLLGPFLGGLTNRTALRCALGGGAALTLPLLIFY